MTVNIWPGFVDALSTLLLAITFVLVTFVLGQFFLNQLLQGKDTQLQSLEQAISQLTEQLNLEQATSSELRLSVSQLSSDLQSALADRDDTAALLAEVEAERDQFRDQVFLLEDEQALLNQTLSALREDVAPQRGAAGRAGTERRPAREAAGRAGAGAPDDHHRSADDRDAARAADPAAPGHRGPRGGARRARARRSPR